MIIDVCKSLNGMPISERAKREALEKMTSTMEEALEVKFTIDDFIAVLQDLPTEGDGELVEYYDRKIDEAMRCRREDSRVSNHPQRKRLEQMLRSEEDEEVMIDESQTEASLIDPMTQKLLEEPMRSKKCAHVYSKASVDHFFARTAHCAHPGCSAKLSKKDFERDAETEIALKRLAN
ncbi:MAG: NSE2 family E3 SUMO-protein ligase, partial [Planctomycetota bacterium]